MQYMDRNLDILCTTWTIHWTIAVKHGRPKCENLNIQNPKTYKPGRPKCENMQNMDDQNVKTWAPMLFEPKIWTIK